MLSWGRDLHVAVSPALAFNNHSAVGICTLCNNLCCFPEDILEEANKIPTLLLASTVVKANGELESDDPDAFICKR